LALQPTELTLVTEKATALNMLGRPSESLPLLEKALADDQQLGDVAGRARAMRAQGWALIELKRLDEAEAVFHQSLSLEPGNCMALGELGYIAQRRAEANPRSGPSQLKTTEQARIGCNQT
jgi:Flp pilus assembly protein TadD